MKKLVCTLLLASSMLTAPVFAQPTSTFAEPVIVAPVTLDVLKIDHASIKHVPGTKTAAIYCAFSGPIDQDLTVTGVIANYGTAAFHAHTKDENTGAHHMHHVDKIVIPKGITVDLESKHHHVMITDLPETFKGPIELTFEYTVGASEELRHTKITVKNIKPSAPLPPSPPASSLNAIVPESSSAEVY